MDEYAMMERFASTKPSKRSFGEILDDAQLMLGSLGLTPIVGEPADAIDGVISLARGDYSDAWLSGGAMLPFLGTGAGITKICKRADRLDELTDFSRAAGEMSNKGDFTRAGHSLTKHSQGSRQGNSLFPTLSGNTQQINNQAQDIVDDILTSPGGTVLDSFRGRFGNTIEFSAPDGRGIVFDENKKFLFFKEN